MRFTDVIHKDGEIFLAQQITEKSNFIINICVRWEKGSDHEGGH